MDDSLKYIDVIESVSPAKGQFSSFADFFSIAISYLLAAGVTLTFISIIVSGIKFVTSRSDIKALDQAKKALTYSIVGFILTLGAFSILNLVFNSLGIKTITGSNNSSGTQSSPAVKQPSGGAGGQLIPQTREAAPPRIQF